MFGASVAWITKLDMLNKITRRLKTSC